MRDSPYANMREACHVLRHIGRPLTVSEPCLGLAGWMRLSCIAQASVVIVNGYEWDKDFKTYYDQISRACPNAQLFWESTDLELIEPSCVKDSEMLVAGPPCAAFSNSGYRLGSLDVRSQIYEKVVDMKTDI